MARLRVHSGREVCAILRRHGFEEARRRGSHAIMRKRVDGVSVIVPIPMHREIRRGTLMAIIDQSGIPRSEFE